MKSPSFGSFKNNFIENNLSNILLIKSRFLTVFPDITKSLINAFVLGNLIICFNNFPIINFEIKANSSILEIFLNLSLIKMDIILQIYLIVLGSNLILSFKSKIN